MFAVCSFRCDSHPRLQRRLQNHIRHNMNINIKHLNFIDTIQMLQSFLILDEAAFLKFTSKTWKHTWHSWQTVLKETACKLHCREDFDLFYRISGHVAHILGFFVQLDHLCVKPGATKIWVCSMPLLLNWCYRVEMNTWNGNKNSNCVLMLGNGLCEDHENPPYSSPP